MKITILENPNTETELIIHCSDQSAPEIQEILQFANNAGRKIVSQQKDNWTMIDPKQVLYGEFVNRTVFIYTEDAVYPTALTLTQIEQDYNGFFRCSKSMVVNIQCIKQLKSEFSGRILAILRNGERILISRHYASKLRKRLTTD